MELTKFGAGKQMSTRVSKSTHFKKMLIFKSYLQKQLSCKFLPQIHYVLIKIHGRFSFIDNI